MNIVSRGLTCIALAAALHGGAGSAATCPLGCGLPRPAPTQLDAIAARFERFDIDADGVAEINSIRPMWFESAQPAGVGRNGLAIILIEPRLLRAPDPAGTLELQQRLLQHRDDLVADGYQVRCYQADLYSGTRNQDGRTVLALRRFLRAVHTEYATVRLAGVTLVGSFPEATLFRQVLLRERVAADEPFLQSLILHPERINPQSHLVLADLDGNWEALYLPELRATSYVLEAPLDSQQTPPYSTTAVVRRADPVYWQDAFFIRDDRVDVGVPGVPAVGSVVPVQVHSYAQRHPEITAADRLTANPLARPEIHVSAINARGIAVNPTGPIDLNGRFPLDRAGRPQVVDYPPGTSMTWARDSALELRILNDYLRRNHEHRTGLVQAGQHRTAAIQAFGSGLEAPAETNAYLRPADPQGFGASLGWAEASIHDYVDFLRTPAVLRGVAAHSNAYVSEFGPPASAAGFAAAVGPTPWAWERKSNSVPVAIRHSPSATALGNNAHWALGRTLFENRVLAQSGSSFFVHQGCSLHIADDNWPDVAYDHPRYGEKNAAASLLFFSNGLGMLTRGKVFYDLPSDVGSHIALSNGRFGHAWRATFAGDAANGAQRPGTGIADYRVHSNKKAYMWTLGGDWTLKLRY